MKTARKIESIFWSIPTLFIAVLIAYMISLIALTVISDEPVMAIRQFIVGRFYNPAVQGICGAGYTVHIYRALHVFYVCRE